MANLIRRKAACVGSLVAAFGLGACAGPPEVAPGTLLGYGTPGVESYVPRAEAASLADLQNRCRVLPKGGSAAPRPQTLEAACDQLHRTARNQPGSALLRPGTF